MGIYLNPENDGFWEKVRSKIYVDKTGLIAHTNKYLRKEHKCLGGISRIRELPTGRGFADVVFLPLSHTGKPALVVELKYDKSADAAI